MTANQIAYLNAMETARKNQAAEDLERAKQDLTRISLSNDAEKIRQSGMRTDAEVEQMQANTGLTERRTSQAELEEALTRAREFGDFTGAYNQYKRNATNNENERRSDGVVKDINLEKGVADFIRNEKGAGQADDELDMARPALEGAKAVSGFLGTILGPIVKLFK